jgi:hypothetical protein
MQIRKDVDMICYAIDAVEVAVAVLDNTPDKFVKFFLVVL